MHEQSNSRKHFKERVSQKIFSLHRTCCAYSIQCVLVLCSCSVLENGSLYTKIFFSLSYKLSHFRATPIVPILWPQAYCGFGCAGELWVNLNSAAFCSIPLFASICPLSPDNGIQCVLLRFWLSQFSQKTFVQLNYILPAFCFSSLSLPLSMLTFE